MIVNHSKEPEDGFRVNELMSERGIMIGVEIYNLHKLTQYLRDSAEFKGQENVDEEFLIL